MQYADWPMADSILGAKVNVSLPQPHGWKTWGTVGNGNEAWLIASPKVHYSFPFTHEATEIQRAYITQNHTVSKVQEVETRPQTYCPKEPCPFLAILNLRPTKMVQMSLCLLILLKSPEEKTETLYRCVWLGSTLLVAATIPQETSNKNVPRTQYIDQLYHPSQIKQQDAWQGEQRRKSFLGPWTISRLGEAGGGQACLSSAFSPPLGYLHFTVVLDDLKSPVKVLGCG